jgi:sulfur carrier protein ThiS adenylyltransferase
MITGAFYEDIIKKIGKANFDKIQKARIGIAGLGGLGSNCASNLVRVGFKKFTLVDFDVIDPGNLDRQFYFQDQVEMAKVEALKMNLLRINPELDLKTFKKKIEAPDVNSVFGDCEIVAECFDKAEFKSMLVTELLKTDKFIVTVSGLGGVGSSDDIKAHKLKKNLVMIGDLKSDTRYKPPLSPRVNIAAAKQADTIFDFILNTA